MAKLFIVRGLPGSGKSTFAKLLLSQGVAQEHVEADMFRYNTEGDYIFDPKDNPRVHEECRVAVGISLFEKKDVVVSNTFVKKWEMEPYLRLAALFEAEVVIMKMENRLENIHNVPQEIVNRMEKGWEDVG